jgi:hypothetical protein
MQKILNIHDILMIIIWLCPYLLCKVEVHFNNINMWQLFKSPSYCFIHARESFSMIRSSTSGQRQKHAPDYSRFLRDKVAVPFTFPWSSTTQIFPHIHFPKLDFNIILPSTPCFRPSSFFQILYLKLFMQFLVSHAHCMSCPLAPVDFITLKTRSEHYKQR